MLLGGVLLLRRRTTDEIGHTLVRTKQPEDALARFGRQNRFQEDHCVHQSEREGKEAQISLGKQQKGRLERRLKLKFP